MAAAAAGWVAHTGWAAGVVVAGTRVVDRLRVELVSGPAAVYHLGAKTTLAEATALVDAARKEAWRRAREEIRKLDVAAVGVVASAGRPLPELEEILRVHALVHAAEGELYRRALLNAAQALGLRTLAVPAEAAKAAADKVVRPEGPPWAADQKLAAAAAYLALR